MRKNSQAMESHEAFKNIKAVFFDFDGVFTDNTVWVDERGRESVRCFRGDGLGIAQLKKTGIPAFVLSGEANSVVSARCRKLKIRCFQGLENKGYALERLMVKLSMHPSEAAFVGNDINDVDCLKKVGLPIVTKDAHPSAKKLAKYQTKRKGGQGAVREICDLLMDSHDK